MKNRIAKHVLFTITFSAIPAFLSYMANSSFLFDKLKQSGFLVKNADISLIQNYCLILGIIISTIALSANLCIKKLNTTAFWKKETH